MQQATETPTVTTDATAELAASAARADAWAGEPFLHPGEDAAQVLAPGTAITAYKQHVIPNPLMDGFLALPPGLEIALVSEIDQKPIRFRSEISLLGERSLFDA